ncbi:protein kinase family protein isoform X2 [Wolffia australiana]
MGKKKRSSGGRRAKGRAVGKDRSSLADDDSGLLSEELTALSAIFEEDFRIISESPNVQFTINLRPHTNDVGNDELGVSAVLSVRCLPGYPYKCPKLHISPEKGLTKDDVDRLLSLLIDQANFNAREGRVMIFNLVEAAQEFLSDIVPRIESQILNFDSGTGKNWHADDGQCLSPGCLLSAGTFVHGSYDLYSDMGGGSWDQLLEKHVLDDREIKIPREQITPVFGRGPTNAVQRITKEKSVGKKVMETLLDDFQYEVDLGSEGSSGSAHSEIEFRRGTLKNILHEDTSGKELELESKVNRLCVHDAECMSEPIRASVKLLVDDDKSQNARRDLILVHLLRILSSSKVPLSFSSSDIASELSNLGMLSEWGKDLLREPSLFDKAFENAFRPYMASSRISQFWKITSDANTAAPAGLKSRYLTDFEELSPLGHGGFGHVVLCKNKLDGRHYAVKKIRLKDKNLSVNDKILREVATLSRLQHQHVVRYYQAWFETGSFGYHTLDSMSLDESTFSHMGASSMSSSGQGNSQEMTFLYIQMEYCPRTLRQDLNAFKTIYDKQATWYLCRQIVEGLAHIHSQGIIHRDLTPNNIFFDARNDVKIGDFGLAKFLKLEQVDQPENFPAEVSEVSLDGTGQVGTPFYTAPEVEQGWPQINEKVDMYSLGVVFFELWHPFTTAMERHIVLSELKQNGNFPSAWANEFPDQASLVRRLMSQSPSDRPTAVEILRRELPPRMEDEWLNDVLRTIQTSEDTYVYDHILSTIFDEERIMMKARRQRMDVKVVPNDSPFRQPTVMASELRDSICEVCKEVFSIHGGKRVEIAPIHLFDGLHSYNRKKTVKLLTSSGNMLELCHDLRSPFVSWVVENQKANFKRYEISWVHRKSVGHSTPNRFLQGDFDIIGGIPTLSTSEVLKTAMEVVSKFFHPDTLDIRLNHAKILQSIWSWAGIDDAQRQNVAELLSLMSSLCPQSTSRKSIWGFIRRQLIQDHDLTGAMVDKLHAVDLRFCGPADQALARLRGAISSETTHKALQELSDLLTYVRVWRIEKRISLDVLMPPEDSDYRGLYFQIYLIKESNPSSVSESTLLAVGGCYDHLLHQMWNHKTNPPGAVGISLALEKILHQPSLEIKQCRSDLGFSILVCSRGGGGMLEERMELVAELWQANLKAEFVLLQDPSLTLQYEYAYEHDFKCLIIITPDSLQTGYVKFRHLELKKEREIQRDELVKVLNDAISSQFRSPTIWN